MRRRVLPLMTCVLGVAISAYAGEGNNVQQDSKVQYGFIENKGQIVDQNDQPNAAVKYLLNTPGLNVQLRKDGFSYDAYTTDEKEVKLKLRHLEAGAQGQAASYKFHRVDITLEGCNTNAEVVTQYPGSDYINYYLNGKEVTAVHHYGKIVYKNIYSNIDLEFSAKRNGDRPLEYDFIVYPGGDPSQIKMKYAGADKVSLTDERINMTVRQGILKEQIPASFIAGTNTPVMVSYRQLSTATYSYQVGAYDKAQTLIIDPTPMLSWATYYGGSQEDAIQTISVKGNSLFAAGYTLSTSNIATTGAYQTSFAGTADAALIKFNLAGARQWATYFGGSGVDIAFGATAAGNGDVIIGGQTASTTGISTNGTSFVALADGFIARFSNTGSRIWAGYYGGNGFDRIYSVAADGQGDIAFCGLTSSTYGIATNNAPVSTSALGNFDSFVGKINNTGTGYYWTTFLGTNELDEAYAVAVDGNNDVYVSGLAWASTNGSQFIATTNGSQQYHGGDSTDFYLMKISSSGSLQWGTYYGGTGGEVRSLTGGQRIATDPFNNVYLVGSTYSQNAIATIGSFQTTAPNTVEGGLIAKFNSSGQRLWGTYFGGVNDETGIYGVNTDASGNVYVTGNTTSFSGLATTNAFQTSNGGNINALVAKFNGSGTRQWTSYFGGSSDAFVSTVAVDSAGCMYMAGLAVGAGYSSADGFQPGFNGVTDGIIAKFTECLTPVNATATPFDACGNQNNGMIKIVTTGGTSPYQYALGTGSFQTNDTFKNLNSISYTVYVRDILGCRDTVTTSIGRAPQITATITGAYAPVEASTQTYSVPAQTGATYNWTVTGGTLNSGQNTPQISVTWGTKGAGEVKVVVGQGNHCADSSTLVINKIGTGINDIQADMQVRMYPNPTTDRLHIELNNVSVNELIKLYDNSGRLILQQSAQKEQILDIRVLPAGLYHLQIGEWHGKVEKL